MIIRQKDPVANLADDFGRRYADLQEEKGVLDEKIGNLSQAIKSKAEKLGRTYHNKDVTLMGTQYAVGYFRCDPKMEIDEEAAKKLLSPELLKQIQVTVLDESRLVRLCNQGKISLELLRKIVTPKGAPVHRLFVKAAETFKKTHEDSHQD